MIKEKYKGFVFKLSYRDNLLEVDKENVNILCLQDEMFNNTTKDCPKNIFLYDYVIKQFNLNLYK